MVVLPVGATIQAAELRLHRTGVMGANPFGILGSLTASIKKGTFGLLGLELTDFAAAASAPKVGTFGTVLTADGYLVAKLGPAGLANINTAGPTQFRISFATPTNSNGAANGFKFDIAQLVIYFLP